MKRSVLPASLAPALALILALVLAACGTSDDDPPEAFSVTFALASVPLDLTLDSLEVEIAVGDSGNPQAFTVDLNTGTSRAQVLSYPGQRYALDYVLYASGFDIGRGRDSGSFAADMRIELAPRWNAGKVEAARALRASGVLLPPSLATLYGTAVAGRPMEFGPDSAAGLDYAWYVRRGDTLLASGEGARLRWTPPLQPAPGAVNVKFIVKRGNRILEERDWDVALLAARPDGRVAGIITRNHPASSLGTYTRFHYGPSYRLDSLLVYDAVKPDPFLTPSTTVAYEYHPGAAGAERVAAARRRGEGLPPVDSLFAYDGSGRLIALTVMAGEQTTTDSLVHREDGSRVIRSFSRGALMREVRTVRFPDSLEVDSVFAPDDGGLDLTGLVERLLDGLGRDIGRRTYRRMGGTLVHLETETVHYNALGGVASRKLYREGGTLLLERSETWYYGSTGLLERVTVVDEVTGDYLEVRNYEYVIQARSLGKRGALAGSGHRPDQALAQLDHLASRFPLSSLLGVPASAAGSPLAKEAP